MRSCCKSVFLSFAITSTLAGEAVATDLIYKCVMTDRQEWVGGTLYDSLVSDPPHGVFNINLNSGEYTVISRQSGEIIGSEIWQTLEDGKQGKRGIRYLFLSPEPTSVLRVNQRVGATTFAMMDGRSVYAGECSLAFGAQ